MQPQSPRPTHFLLGIFTILCLLFLLSKGRPSYWKYESKIDPADSTAIVPKEPLILMDSVLQLDSVLVSTPSDSIPNWVIDTTVIIDTFWNATTPPIITSTAKTPQSPSPNPPANLPIGSTLFGIGLFFLLLYGLQRWIVGRREKKYWLQYQAPLYNLYPESAPIKSVPTTVVPDTTLTEVPLEVIPEETTTPQEDSQIVTEEIPFEQENTPELNENLYHTTEENTDKTIIEPFSNRLSKVVLFPIKLVQGIGIWLVTIASFLLKKTTTLPQNDLGWKDIVSVLFLLGFLPIWSIFIDPTNNLLLKIGIIVLLWCTPSFFRSDWKAAVLGILLFITELLVVGIYLALQYGGDGGEFPWKIILGFVALIGGLLLWLRNNASSSSNQNTSTVVTSIPAITPSTPDSIVPPPNPSPVVTQTSKENLLKNPKELPQWWKKINLSTLLEIDMSDEKLTVDHPFIETYLMDATHLERLHLSKNQFTILPTETTMLKHLVYLDLSDNQISSISEYINYNYSIESLLLNNNNISIISESLLHRLRQLKHLELKGNPLSKTTIHQLETTFPDTKILFDKPIDKEKTSLEKQAAILLEKPLSNIPYSTFSAELSEQKWETIPHTPLNQLIALKILYLSGNKLTAIPSVIYELPALERLHLYNNKITEVTEKALCYLKMLVLDRNPVNQLPTELSQPSILTELSLSSCQLQELPSVLLQMPKLKSINLERNNITKIPSFVKELKGLEDLRLLNNPLKEIPLELFELVQLKTLTININNRRAIPSEISQLKNLEELNIGFSDKNLQIPADFFSKHLPQIKKLHLSSLFSNKNPLQIKFDQLSDLRDIWLGYNYLSEFPESIFNLPKVRLLGLDSNQISHIPEKITQLTTLEVLFLDDNKKVDILPEYLLNMPKIRWITVRNTSILPSILAGYKKNYPHINIEVD